MKHNYSIENLLIIINRKEFKNREIKFTFHKIGIEKQLCDFKWKDYRMDTGFLELIVIILKRSILWADPRKLEMKAKINKKIKILGLLNYLSQRTLKQIMKFFFETEQENEKIS